MVRDLHMTPSSIEMRVRIKGARAALAGWEPDILGLSIRWLFCQMMGWLDSQSNEWDHRDRDSQIRWWGLCVGRGSDIFFCCWWSAGGDEAVQ